MEDFETYRPLLLAIAYRMTGSMSEAEDIVQEAYLRLSKVTATEIRSLRSYLSTLVTRLCLDYLKSARVERERYIGTWLPEPILTEDMNLLPEDTIEMRESISMAFLVLLETLTPPERAVFLLHEVFDYAFPEIGEIIGKSTANCRQIFHRAKEHLATQHQRFEPSPAQQQHLLRRFLAACQSGDLAALTDVLAQDVTAWADGGGKVTAALRPVLGLAAVARYCLGIISKTSRRYADTFAVNYAEVNGSPALLIWADAHLFSLLTFTGNEQMHKIWIIRNPEKLAFIQQQLAAR
ncbi:RNA polymerase sigma-70 factor [Tengunoibacter tsumagoiensis]|uniref:DNA-directed RNA polymerase sigma-70 factor n=1 Tax=Tengunoibacter tsumagoiensis TaxID=2014871 RepID=A0A402A859_9CHLR|nr:RNA polymerase sigma-70 factor [Tengunoibacter tsumagoiensis]GCE15333.1 DNA-directed RNA polymerase sigma-70 factor [Tengunoibacter tsumagoiensis]